MILFRLVIVSFIAAFLISGISPGLCSPIYSSNGIGQIVHDEAGRPKTMGGAGIANDDGKNVLRGNPALLSSFKGHSYSFGATYDKNTAFFGGKENPEYAKTNPDMFKFVVPVAKGIVAGWGLTPFSRAESIIGFTHKDYTDKLTFTGGINVSSISIAGSYRDFIRFGISYNYYFGMIEEKWERTFTNNDGLYEPIDSIKRKYKGSGTTVGILVHLLKNTSVGIGYTGKSDLDKTVRVRPGNYSNPETNYDTGKVSLPARWRFGVSSVFRRRFTACMDISLAQWEKAAITPTEKEMYTNTYRFGAGVRYEPAQTPEKSIYKKLPISAGFKFGTMYYKSHPEVETVFEKAVTFGIELPFKENVASLITSFEFGTRGDKSKNGWDETYTSIGLLLIGTIK